ncbi:helix-turn-helix domain-containing protein [Kineosporia sp. A_224]|uniref:helix-turn-helix domain-containing protein n=1 Tax=Kineosporia sp. A_224 TaxID=1962180 RepID=UPI000B4B3FD8|nr:helix-turn-helix domain-containing protein [Kineosporia sp. A_224]
MANAQMSVAEAAEMLGVHPQRIHQRIRDGSLPAEKIGHQWVLEMDDLRRIERHAGPGRPLSSKSAWDLLLVAGEGGASAGLSPSARSRARSRLRLLLSHTSSDDPDDVAVHLVRALGNRAERRLFAASPRDLPALRDDQRVHLSGVSLPASNMSVAAVAEGYVHPDELDGLVDDYLLSPAARSRANVILHVVPFASSSPALAGLDAVAGSPLAIAADLAEHDGIRERNEALRSLAGLHARF